MWQTEVKHGTNQELEQSCTARQIHYTCSTDNWINLGKGLKEKRMQLSERSQRGNKWCRQPTKEGRKPNSNCFSTLHWTQSKASCVPGQESCKRTVVMGRERLDFWKGLCLQKWTNIEMRKIVGNSGYSSANFHSFAAIALPSLQQWSVASGLRKYANDHSCTWYVTAIGKSL